MKVAPALPRLRFVWLELAPNRAGLEVRQARGVVLGGRHVSLDQKDECTRDFIYIYRHKRALLYTGGSVDGRGVVGVLNFLEFFA